MPTTTMALDALFHLRMVAVTGASADGTGHGPMLLHDTGFRGAVYGAGARNAAAVPL